MKQEEIDQYRNWIQLGRADDVLKALDSLSLKKAVSSKTVLNEMLSVLRRIGAYDEALKLISWFDDRSPERNVEEALILGELGATRSALKTLQAVSSELLPAQLQFDFYFHLGNFQSLVRDFAASHETFQKLESKTELSSLQLGIAKLNRLGAEVYMRTPDASLLSQLEVLAKAFQTSSFFALEQGAYYFAAYFAYWTGREEKAEQFIDAALSLGVQHRLRESLMLELLAQQISPDPQSWPALSEAVGKQAHAIYWDQFNYIRTTQGNEPLDQAESQARLLLHNEPNDYVRSVSNDLKRDPYFLRLSNGDVELLSPTQTRTFKASDSFPIIRADGTSRSVSEYLTGQNAQILEILLRRQSFGIRDAELWEKVWATNFAENSADALRKAIDRIRNTDEILSAVDIQSSGRRYFAKPKKGVKVIFQNSLLRSE